MRSGLEIFSVLLLLTPQCSSTSCRTCKNEECSKKDIPIIECNKNVPMLPFQLQSQKNKEQVLYGCLQLEYLNGNSLTALQQCIITEDISKFCSNIAKIVHVVQCIVSLSTKIALKTDTSMDNTSTKDNYKAIDVGHIMVSSSQNDEYNTTLATSTPNYTIVLKNNESESTIDENITIQTLIDFELNITKLDNNNSESKSPTAQNFDFMSDVPTTEEIYESPSFSSTSVDNSDQTTITPSTNDQKDDDSWLSGNTETLETADQFEIEFESTSTNSLVTTEATNLSTRNSFEHSHTENSRTPELLNETDVNNLDTTDFEESTYFTPTETIKQSSSLMDLEQSTNEPAHLHEIAYVDVNLEDFNATDEDLTKINSESVDPFENSKTIGAGDVETTVLDESFDLTTMEEPYSSTMVESIISESKSTLTTLFPTDLRSFIDPSTTELTNSNYFSTSDLNLEDLNITQLADPEKYITTINTDIKNSSEDSITIQTQNPSDSGYSKGTTIIDELSYTTTTQEVYIPVVVDLNATNDAGVDLTTLSDYLLITSDHSDKPDTIKKLQTDEPAITSIDLTTTEYYSSNKNSEPTLENLTTSLPEIVDNYRDLKSTLAVFPTTLDDLESSSLHYLTTTQESNAHEIENVNFPDSEAALGENLSTTVQPEMVISQVESDDLENSSISGSTDLPSITPTPPRISNSVPTHRSSFYIFIILITVSLLNLK